MCEDSSLSGSGGGLHWLEVEALRRERDAAWAERDRETAAYEKLVTTTAAHVGQLAQERDEARRWARYYAAFFWGHPVPADCEDFGGLEDPEWLESPR